MLKRTAATLIAGTFAAIANISGATESPFPPSTEDILYRMNPVQERYFKEREAAMSQRDGGSAGARATRAVESPFPPSTEDILYRMTPSQERYFAEREAANPRPTGASGSPFPTGRLQ